SLIGSSTSLFARSGADRDPARLRFLHLGQRERQDAVRQHGLRLLDVDLRGQGQRARESIRKALAAARRIALGHDLLALSFQRDRVRLEGELEILLLEARNLCPHDERFTGVLEGEARPKRCGLGAPVGRKEPFHVAPEPVEHVEGEARAPPSVKTQTTEIIPVREHCDPPRQGTSGRRRKPSAPSTRKAVTDARRSYRTSTHAKVFTPPELGKG